MWAGGGSAVAPNRTLSVQRDPRALRDRQYQSKMRQDIVNWLIAHEYDISMQTLMNIHAKAYQTIFRQLIMIIDSEYIFLDGAKLEEEVIPALKCMEYPFLSQLDIKWLAAPASMHSWPSLLGVLHWLVELGKVNFYKPNTVSNEAYMVLKVSFRLLEQQ
jgi:kinetochore protein NDC80